jgi:hypothetical protein
MLKGRDHWEDLVVGNTVIFEWTIGITGEVINEQ